jgi:gliding motility-associated-like protein
MGNPRCNTYYSFEIAAPPRISIDLGEDQTILLEEQVQLQLTSNVDLNTLNWEWNTDYNFDCSSCPNPSGTPLKSIYYILEARNADGCTARDTVYIRVIDNKKIVIPNIFTPSSEDRNSQWDVHIPNGYTIKNCSIYDRWGSRVYQVKNSNTVSWDGKFKGQPVLSGVYIYSISYTDDNGKETQKSGDLTVIY